MDCAVPTTLLAITVSALSLSIAAPIRPPPVNQPACTWDQQTFTVIYPKAGTLVPLDASVWIVENETIPRLSSLETAIVRNETFAEIPFETIRTRLPGDKWLVQLKPRGELKEGESYDLRIEGNGGTFSAAQLSAGPAGTPRAPVIERISSNVDQGYGKSCDTLGVIVRVQSEAPLLFAYDESGDLRGVSQYTWVVAEDASEGTQLCLEVVAVDAAGRKSDPVEAGCAAAGIDPDYRTNTEDEPSDSIFGCTGARGSVQLFPLVLVFVGLILLSLRTVTIGKK